MYFLQTLLTSKHSNLHKQMFFNAATLQHMQSPGIYTDAYRSLV